MTRRPARGFTLIEMVVVVLIVGILASAAMPMAALHKQRARESELRQNLRTLRNAIDAYKRAYDQGRIEHKVDASGYPPSLDVLVKGVKDAQNAKGAMIYFLRRLPRDPFADPDVPDARSWGLRAYSSPPEAPAPGADVFQAW
jgi:general secretion pathway protein G